MSSSNQRYCFYCDGAARNVRRGEHIIPDAIGGTLTISEVCRGRTVCNPCNNGPLSELDAELCSRSALSIAAAHDLGGFLWQTWDVDERTGNLLLEAKPDYTAQSMTVYPQMIFERDGPQLRGDHEQIQSVGPDGFQSIFVPFMREAFRAFESGDTSRLNPKNIQANEWLLKRYRYPPRVFARRHIKEFAKGMSFEFQYLSAADKRFALSQLENWDSSKSFGRFEIQLGSELPALHIRADAGKVLRALFKISVNLLAAHCPNTPINREEFGRVIQVIRGETAIPNQLFQLNGFVYATDLDPIKAPDRAHSVRLLYMDGWWNVYLSFFGGRIGAFTRFPGPNGEQWCCADIVAPLNSKNWTVKTSRILQPLHVHIEWADVTKLIPSITMLNVESGMEVVKVTNRRKRK